MSLGIPSPFGTSYSWKCGFQVATRAAAQDGRALLQRSHRGLLRHHGHRVATRQGLHCRTGRQRPVTIVNQTMAKTYWPGKEAIGQCIMLGLDSVPPRGGGGGDRRARAADAAREEPMLQYYVPVDQT